MKQMAMSWRVSVLACMTLMTGCIKYYDLAESEFPQAEKEPVYSEVVHGYKRSQVVYDEFETKAAFDALWLSDDVRTTYIQIYAKKRGLGAEAKEELLKRQLEENKHWVSFYVLADVRERAAGTLGDSTTAWTMFASVDDQQIPAESVKECDLEPEYQLLFGAQGVTFKTCYLVKFPIGHGLSVNLAEQTFKKLCLTIGSPKRKAVLQWQPEELKSKKVSVSDEDFYWG
jgi:hypothetical protein